MFNATFSEEYATMMMGLMADARTGVLRSGTYAVSTSVISITLPDTAVGFRIRPLIDIRYAVGEDPQTATADTLRTGGIAKAGEATTHLIEGGASRTLRLLATGATSVEVVVF